MIAQPIFQHIPFTIEKKGDETCNIVIELEGVTKYYSPEEVLAFLLQKLYSDAKLYAGEDHSVVLCTPGIVDNRIIL